MEEQKRKRRKVSEEKKNAENSEESNSKTVLTIDNFQGPFFLILVGYGVAFATFLVEIISKQIQKMLLVSFIKK